MTNTKRKRTTSPGSAPHDGDTRERVLRAALELFAERGYHGTSIPALAERAGVGAGSLYHHFAGKEELVNELYVRWTTIKTQFLIDPTLVDLAPRDRFGALWRRIFSLQRKHPPIFQFLERHHGLDVITPASRRVHERGREALAMAIAQAQEARAVKRLPPDHVTAMVLGAALGLMTDERDKHKRLTDQEIADAEQCMWEAIRL